MALATINFDAAPGAGVKTLASNFMDTYDYTKKFAPDVHNQVFNPFNYASMGGILEAMGATEEFGKTADTHMWVESGSFMPVAKKGVTLIDATGEAGVAITSLKVSTNATTKEVILTALPSGAKLPFRVGDIVQVVKSGKAIKGVVSANGTGAALSNIITVKSYGTAFTAADWTVAQDAECTITKIGNNVTKGASAQDGSVGLGWKKRQNRFQIAIGTHEENLSDMPNASWFEMDGSYNWTNKEFDAAKIRFLLHREFQMLTSENTGSGTGAADDLGLQGSEGVFTAIKARGNNWTGGDFMASNGITDLENLIKRLEIAGAPSNMMYLCDTDSSLAFDKAVAGLNNIQFTDSTKGKNYGDFQNSNDTVLGLGFKGVEWGSYKFFKKPLAALTNPESPLHASNNDATAGYVRGMMIPMGETPVTTDFEKGQKSVPYITMMYKGGNGEDRRLKTTMIDWKTTGVDKVKVNYLSEFMVRTACPNKMVLFT